MRRSFFLSVAATVVLVLAGSRAVGAAPAGGAPVSLRASDGTRLAATYYSAGEKPGPGILLCHQCNRDRSSWNELAEKLARAGFHVLTVDYRGYGQSGGNRHLDLPDAERDRIVRDVWPRRSGRRIRVPPRAAGSDGGDGRRRRELRRQQLDPALEAPSGDPVARSPLGRHRPVEPPAPKGQVLAAAPDRGRGRRRERRAVHGVDRRVPRATRQTDSSSTRPAATAPRCSRRIPSCRTRSSPGTRRRSSERASPRPPTTPRDETRPRPGSW